MCTRIFWNDNGVARVVTRTLDWAIDDEPDLWVLPRGLRRGGDAGSAHPHEWESRYASVVTSFWRAATIDGINEAGLAGHTLYIDDPGYPDADARPAVGNTLWLQYLLDNFASVAEAVQAADAVRIDSPLIRGQHLGAHIALEDATGDSAILEPIDGTLVVHHGPQFTVMANAPTLDEQLANLARYQPFGGELSPPGDIASADRFVRAAYYLNYLPAPEDARQAMARLFQVSGNVAVPPGAPYQDGGVYPTWWTSGIDLTNATYYFRSSTASPSILWLDLADAFASDEVRRLNPQDPALAGDIAGDLRPAQLTYGLPA